MQYCSENSGIAPFTSFTAPWNINHDQWLLNRVKWEHGRLGLLYKFRATTIHFASCREGKGNAANRLISSISLVTDWREIISNRKISQRNLPRTRLIYYVSSYFRYFSILQYSRNISHGRVSKKRPRRVKSFWSSYRVTWKYFKRGY